MSVSSRRITPSVSTFSASKRPTLRQRDARCAWSASNNAVVDSPLSSAARTTFTFVVSTHTTFSDVEAVASLEALETGGRRTPTLLDGRSPSRHATPSGRPDLANIFDVDVSTS